MNEEDISESSGLPTKLVHTPSEAAWMGENKRALEDPYKFWEEHASVLDWYKKWDKVLDESNAPFYRWFVNGKLNVSYNAIDRHILHGKRNQAAYIWIAENGQEYILTYCGLMKRVNAFAKALLDAGLKKGDRIVIYLPMIPELPIAMLAAARIGVIFSVVFSGFGSEALASRINDSGARLLVTADGGFRRGKVVPLKKLADNALNFAKTIEQVIVVKRTGIMNFSSHWRSCSLPL